MTGRPLCVLSRQEQCLLHSRHTYYQNVWFKYYHYQRQNNLLTCRNHFCSRVAHSLQNTFDLAERHNQYISSSVDDMTGKFQFETHNDPISAGSMWNNGRLHRLNKSSSLLKIQHKFFVITHWQSIDSHDQKIWTTSEWSENKWKKQTAPFSIFVFAISLNQK